MTFTASWSVTWAQNHSIRLVVKVSSESLAPIITYIKAFIQNYLILHHLRFDSHNNVAGKIVKILKN